MMKMNKKNDNPSLFQRIGRYFATADPSIWNNPIYWYGYYVYEWILEKQIELNFSYKYYMRIMNAKSIAILQYIYLYCWLLFGFSLFVPDVNMSNEFFFSKDINKISIVNVGIVSKSKSKIDHKLLKLLTHYSLYFYDNKVDVLINIINNNFNNILRYNPYLYILYCNGDEYRYVIIDTEKNKYIIDKKVINDELLEERFNEKIIESNEDTNVDIDSIESIVDVDVNSNTNTCDIENMSLDDINNLFGDDVNHSGKVITNNHDDNTKKEEFYWIVCNQIEFTNKHSHLAFNMNEIIF